MNLTAPTVAAFAALSIAAGGAIAGDDEGGGPPAKDRVAGTGFFFAVDGTVHVNAKSGPNGENPRGRFRVGAFGSIDVRGEVTCLNVQGRGAVISGLIQKGRPENFRGRGVRIEIRDNQGVRPKLRDEFNFDAGVIQEPLTVCPPPGAFALFPVDRGNFTVHDGLEQGPPGGGDDDDGDDEDDGDGDDEDEDDDDEGWDDLTVQSEQLPAPLAPMNGFLGS